MSLEHRSHVFRLVGNREPGIIAVTPPPSAVEPPKTLKKELLGRVGRLFQTLARKEKIIPHIIYKESETPVPPVPNETHVMLPGNWCLLCWHRWGRAIPLIEGRCCLCAGGSVLSNALETSCASSWAVSARSCRRRGHE